MQDEAKMEPRGGFSILHVSQPTDGGVGGYVADATADQVRRGWRVTVACPAYGTLAGRVLAAGAAHEQWTAGRAPGPTSFLDAMRIRKVVERVQPDLVHLHSSKAGLAGRLALRGRKPTVFQPHAWSFEAVRGPLRLAALAWERRAARWTTVILCVSEGERRRGEEHGIEGDWRVIPNGVDLEAVPEASDEERSAARRRLELDGTPTVVCIGRLCRQKGQDVLLEAWPSVRERVPDAQLVLVGDGPDSKSLRRRAGVGVRLVGQRDDVAEWLAAADVVAAPSRWEGMSFAVLEAMARGRSVVAADVAGASELLDGDAGALVPSEHPAELAEALAARLLDPAKAEDEGRAARRRVERSHDLRTATAAVAELYEAVLSSSTGSRTP